MSDDIKQIISDQAHDAYCCITCLKATLERFRDALDFTVELIESNQKHERFMGKYWDKSADNAFKELEKILTSHQR